MSEHKHIPPRQCSLCGRTAWLKGVTGSDWQAWLCQTCGHVMYSGQSPERKPYPSYMSAGAYITSSERVYTFGEPDPELIPAVRDFLNAL